MSIIYTTHYIKILNFSFSRKNNGLKFVSKRRKALNQDVAIFIGSITKKNLVRNFTPVNSVTNTIVKNAHILTMMLHVNNNYTINQIIALFKCMAQSELLMCNMIGALLRFKIHFDSLFVIIKFYKD